MAAARERATEQRERLARLPEAVCAACGGIVRAGDGTVADVNPWVADANAWSQVDAERARDGLAPIMGWRRRHDGCATAAGMVGSVLGVEVSALVAGAAIAAIGARPMQSGLLAKDRARHPHRAALANREPDPRPWEHLVADDREALRVAVDRERAKVEPRRCVHGACAWCGVSQSIGWRKSPETWADASSAPLCRDCGVVWDLRTAPTLTAALRAAALEALSGAATFGGRGVVGDLTMRTFSDLAGDDHAGTAERWQYAPGALEAIREAARLAWPSSLPVEIRGDYLERSRREHAAAAQRAAEAAEVEALAAEAERLRLQGWPV